MARTERSINIKDGRLVYRTSAVDELAGLYRPVDDEVAKAIDAGDIPAMKVVNAIMQAERFSDDFDWNAFKKSESALNMRQSVVDQAEDQKEVLKDDAPGSVLKLENIVGDDAQAVRRRRAKPRADAAVAES